MRNAGLEEAQAGIKIAGRNINNLRYADDTTLMAETDGDSVPKARGWSQHLPSLCVVTAAFGEGRLCTSDPEFK